MKMKLKKEMKNIKIKIKKKKKVIKIKKVKMKHIEESKEENKEEIHDNNYKIYFYLLSKEKKGTRNLYKREWR